MDVNLAARPPFLRGMIRLLLPAAALVAGCAGVQDLTLGPWRRVPIPVRAVALAAEEEGHVLVAGEGQLLRVRLSDGAVLRKRDLSIQQEGLVWHAGSIHAMTDTHFVILRNWEIVEEGPVPGKGGEGLAVDRRTGAVTAATGNSLFRWEAGSWKVLGSAEGYMGWIAPRRGEGVVFGRTGLYREGEGFRAYSPVDPFISVFGAWQSAADPGFLFLVANPSKFISRDRGRTFQAVETEFPYGGHLCGFDVPGGRLLFLETNSGKMSLGVIWGPSTLWMSRDDGQTFQKASSPPTVPLGMVESGRSLVLIGQEGGLWVADLVPFDRPR